MRMRLRKLGQKKRNNSGSPGLIALSFPTVLWYVLFCYVPMFGIAIAFKSYHPVPGKSFLYNLFVNSRWVGLENYRFLFLNPRLSAVVRNTISYNLVFILMDTILPVTLAIMLSYLYSGRIRTLTQTISLLPHFLSWVVVSYFLYAFLATDKGLINRVLELLGREPVYFYQTPSAWPAILIVTHIWKSFGYATVMYMAYTVVGEGGANMSGGQCQRLAIARTLLRDYKILILDEATSALDNITQARVQEVLANLRGEKTVIISAHRLSTIINADIIFLIEEGRVLASGTHRELLETCEQYRMLCDEAGTPPE